VGKKRATLRGYKLLFWAAIIGWAFYLASLAPVPGNLEIIRGILRGFFGSALVLAFFASILGSYGALRERYWRYLLPAALALPLAMLSVWDFAHLPFPIRIRN
jgi:polyferredoxin